MKTFQHFTAEAYRRFHRGTDYHGRDYGGTPEDHENAMRRNKAAASLQGAVNPKSVHPAEHLKKKDVNEAGDWWHPDPKKDAAISGAANKMRARENRGQDTSAQTKPDYSNRLKPGETYMQFAKRKQAERSQK